MQIDLRMMAPTGAPKTPGSAIAQPSSADVQSRKFKPKTAGTYTVVGGDISVNGGVLASSVVYAKGDYLLIFLDAPELYSDEDGYTPATCTISGDGGDGYNEVFTVETMGEPAGDLLVMSGNQVMDSTLIMSGGN